MKKLYKILLACMIMFSSLLQTVTPINAEEIPKIKLSLPKHGWEFMTRNGWSAYGEPTEIKYGSKRIYCIEPLVTVSGTKTYSGYGWNPNKKFPGVSYWNPNGYKISEDTADRMSLIAYYVEKKIQETGNVDWYAVGQNAIWKAIGWDGKYTSWKNAYIKTKTHNNFTKMDAAIKELESLADKFYIKPSFNGTKYTLKSGETIRIPDENKVLSEYKVISSGGLDIKIEGNELVVTNTANASTNSRVEFRRNVDEEFLGTSLMYTASNAQTVAMLYVQDPPGLYLDLDVEKLGNLELVKKDDSGVTLTSGFKFKIGTNLNGTEGTDWKYYTTNSDGKITLTGLPTGVTYYYQEVEAKDGYVLDSTIGSVVIGYETTISKTVTNARTGEILLQKTNQDGVNLKNNFTFEFSYNSNMSEPFATATTNGNGRLRVENIKPGTVYYREIAVRTNDEWNYTLDSTIRSVQVHAGEVNLTTPNVTVKNVQDGKLEIIKKDSSTNNVLEGVTFKISKNSDMSSATEYTTDANGIIAQNLATGTYYIQEKTALEGYLPNNEVQKITVSAGQKASITVYNDKFGGLILQKVNQNGVTLGEGFTFEFSYNSNMSEIFATLTTDGNGQINLSNLTKQTVYYREVAVPQNGDYTYSLDSTIKSVTITDKNTVTFNVANNQTAKLEIVKKDESTNEVLKGVSFAISKDAEMNELIGTYTTDANGIITKELDQGTYYIQETATLDYLVLDTTIHKIEVKAGETKNVELFNVRRGNLTLQKVNQDNEMLGKGFTFEFSYKENMSELIGTYTTDANGQISLINLLPQKVYYREKSVPITGEYQYVIDTSVGFVEVKSNETTTKNVVNNEKGKLVLIKVDEVSKSPIQGITFKISKNANMSNAIGEYTTNEEGQIILDLDEGKYYVQETSVVEPYLLDSTIREVEIVGGNTNTLTITNKRQTGQIIITKEDAETGSTAQGQANLNGAVFEITKEGDSTFKEQVTADGRIAKTHTSLPLGTYYVREVIAPEGYTLNPELHKVTLTYDNTKAYVTTNVTVKDEIIRNTFTINKTVDDYLYGMKDLSGFVFKVYNSKNELVDTLSTNAEGKATSTKLIYDTYKIVEEPREGYKPVEPFTFKLDSATQTYEFNIKNNILTAQLKIVKKDAETGKTVLLEGFAFKIIDPEGNYVKQGDKTVFVTNNDGIVMLPKPVKYGKGYQIQEVSVIGNYLLNEEKVPFTVDGTEAIIVKEVVNEFVKGQITVFKQGEVLVGYEDGNFKYEVQPLKNAEFTLYAKENIYSADNQGILLYEKDEVVEVLTTGENGKATSKKLPLGNYYVKETNAPSGYVLSNEVKDATLSYKNDSTELVFNNVSYTNERQQVEVTAYKTSKENGDGLANAKFALYANEDIKDVNGKVLVEKGTKLETISTDANGNGCYSVDLPLNYDFVIREVQAPYGYASTDYEYEFSTDYQGQDKAAISFEAKFENEIVKVQVSKQDITSSEEIAGAKLVVIDKETGNVADEWISGEDGLDNDGNVKPHMIRALVVGKTYILRETVQPYGYALTTDIEFTVEDTGEIQKVVMKDEMIFGQLAWFKQGEIFNDVEKGTSEYGDTNLPKWNTSYLKGAEIEIHAAEDIMIGNTEFYKTGDLVETLKSSDKGVVYSKKLPVGKYYYIETVVPHGYIGDSNKHCFEVKNSGINELQTIESTLTNTRITFDIDVTKVLEEQKLFLNEEAYKDVVFGLYAKEDIKDYFGEVKIVKGSLISISNINENGHLTNVPDLPYGTYFIKELATNSQYVLNETEYVFEVTYKGEDVTKCTIVIDDGTIENDLARGSINVLKVDGDDNTKVLENITFNISIKEDMSEILVTTKTDENGLAEFKDLELGTYYVQEAEQVDGYVLNNNIYKVEVSANGDVLEITVENNPTEMLFSKVDFATSEELPGATIQVTDKETGEIVDEWISTDTPHIIKYLVEGREYVMTETVAPEGYLKAESITFVAKHGEKIVMEDKLTPIDTGAEETVTGPLVAFGISGLSLVILLAIAKRNKKEETEK